MPYGNFNIKQNAQGWLCGAFFLLALKLVALDLRSSVLGLLGLQQTSTRPALSDRDPRTPHTARKIRNAPAPLYTTRFSLSSSLSAPSSALG